ncbi:MAG: hypothetical protein HY615_04240 [Candidatus Rokubacteria bacterium]|nr:hypothetical protein [Candidatus Rokubacteria bacterium]
MDGLMDSAPVSTAGVGSLLAELAALREETHRLKHLVDALAARTDALRDVLPQHDAGVGLPA